MEFILGTEAVVRMEHVEEVGIEAVVDPGEEDRRGTVIRQHNNQV